MPPRPKKPAPSKGPKRTARASKAATTTKPETAGEVKAIEIQPEEVKIDVNAVEENVNEKVSADLNVEQKAEPNGVSADLKKEDEVKEDEYGKDDRLDLEDNEPEFEPEEYGGDYDEKEVDQEELNEEDTEGGEEGDLAEEEDGDMGEDEEDGDMGEDEEDGEMGEDEEEDPEELEGEEDDENADVGEGHEDDQQHGDDHADMTAEEQEHHDHVNERRKRKEFEVFVGGLDKDATEDDLKEVFGVVGEITEVRLMMNQQTKKNKGFAFLRFATVEQAKRAVTELKNPVVKGKQCGVTPSQDNDTLFLGNICKTWTKEKLKEKLKHYGIDNIEDLTLVEDSNTDGMNRGFALLEFSSRSDAKGAFKRLQKKDVLLGVEKPAKVSFADSFVDPGDETMAQVKTVFVDGLPASWDEDRVRELLKKFGEIEKVDLARNMPSARRKDFGFVSFNSHDAALTCAKAINNAELGEGDYKAKVRARLSRPSQRGKGKTNPRGERKGKSRAPGRHLRAPWNRPLPRAYPARARVGNRVPPAPNRGFKRPTGLRDRRPPPPLIPARPRPPPPAPRSYERRAPALPPPKRSLKRDYHRREELPPRSSRAVAEYPSRLPPERRPSYSHRDEYPGRAPVYSDTHRSSASRSASRRSYADDSYAPRYERPPSSYREGRARDYDSVSGSKRSYSAMDDVPSRYVDSSHGVRHSRARLDYDIPAGASQYSESYSDRLGRSNVGYGSGSRSSLSAQDSHGVYSSRQGLSYNGSYGASDGGGVYSSRYGGEYTSRGSDVGGSSYSSLYSSRGTTGTSSYMGGTTSGSYY